MKRVLLLILIGASMRAMEKNFEDFKDFPEMNSNNESTEITRGFFKKKKKESISEEFKKQQEEFQQELNNKMKKLEDLSNEICNEQGLQEIDMNKIYNRQDKIAQLIKENAGLLGMLLKNEQTNKQAKKKEKELLKIVEQQNNNKELIEQVLKNQGDDKEGKKAIFDVLQELSNKIEEIKRQTAEKKVSVKPKTKSHGIFYRDAVVAILAIACFELFKMSTHG